MGMKALNAVEHMLNYLEARSKTYLCVGACDVSGSNNRARGGVRLACVDGGDEVGSTTRVRTSSFGQQPHQIAKHKSKTGFVGLKNMGCICYMNSTLQQVRYTSSAGMLLYRSMTRFFVALKERVQRRRCL